MKLAVSSYEFSAMTFAEIAYFLNDMGVHYLELWPENVANENETEVKNCLEKYEIEISCVSARSQHRLNAEPDDEAQAAIRLAMDLASTYGARYVTTYLGDNPSRDFLTTLKLYQNGLEPCLEEAASRGQIILLENMFDHRNEDPQGTKPSRYVDGMLAIYQAVETMVASDAKSINFGITLDPVNFYITQEEAYPYAYDVLSRCLMPNIHVKDLKKYCEWLDGDKAALPIWPDSITGSYVSLPVGKGVMNWHGIFERLKQDDFDGFITVDILTKEKGREEAYRETVDFIKSQIS